MKTKKTTHKNNLTSIVVDTAAFPSSTALLLVGAGSPLGFDIAGTKETVSAFNKKTFTDYIASLYFPSNAVFVAAGGLSGTPANDIISEKFKGWKNGKAGTFLPIKESQTKPQLMARHKKTEQAHLCVGFRAFSFKDPRRYALQVLSAILGKGMSSRLFMEVRERRGLAYHISSYTDFYADTGTILTHAGIKADKKQVEESIKIILEEHGKIIDGKIKGEELVKVKEMIKGGFILSLEDTLDVASYYGRNLLLQGEFKTPEDTIKSIEKVTIEDVVAVAKDVFVKEGLNMTLISPFTDGETLAKQLVI